MITSISSLCRSVTMCVIMSVPSFSCKMTFRFSYEKHTKRCFLPVPVQLRVHTLAVCPQHPASDYQMADVCWQSENKIRQLQILKTNHQQGNIEKKITPQKTHLNDGSLSAYVWFLSLWWFWERPRCTPRREICWAHNSHNRTATYSIGQYTNQLTHVVYSTICRVTRLHLFLRDWYSMVQTFHLVTTS